MKICVCSAAGDVFPPERGKLSEMTAYAYRTQNKLAQAGAFRWS
jgi:hypothetical protein